MACSGSLTQAWNFAAFFCVSGLIIGTHEGADNAGVLSDSRVNFITRGVEANIGMVLYNLTDNSSGPVTDVTDNTITATLAGGTNNNWDTGDSYRIVTIDAMEIAAIQHYLDVTASDIYAALSAQGACDCDWAEWASGYLAKLNIIDAASFYTCPCGSPNFTAEQQRELREWMTVQLDLIRTGAISVCADGESVDAPAWGIAEIAVTDFAARRIIANSASRRRG